MAAESSTTRYDDDDDGTRLIDKLATAFRITINVVISTFADSDGARLTSSNGTAADRDGTKRAKINKQLKRKRKFMTGDLSCMKSEFIAAPRVANAEIKYIR